MNELQNDVKLSLLVQASAFSQPSSTRHELSWHHLETYLPLCLVTNYLLPSKDWMVLKHKIENIFTPCRGLLITALS